MSHIVTQLFGVSNQVVVSQPGGVVTLSLSAALVNINSITAAASTDLTLNAGSGSQSITSANAIRITGSTIGTGPAAAEMFYNSGSAIFEGYDRTNSLWKPASFQGSTVLVNAVQGALSLQSNSTLAVLISTAQVSTFTPATGGVATTTPGIYLNNTTASLVGATVQYSPSLVLGGQVWNTTATAANNWAWVRQELRPVSGTAPTSALYWSIGLTTTSTPSYTDVMSLGSAGTITSYAGTGVVAFAIGSNAMAIYQKATNQIAFSTNSADVLHLNSDQTATFLSEIVIDSVNAGLGTGSLSTNTCFGVAALAGANTGTGNNVAIGYHALTANTTGSGMTAVGYLALSSASTITNSTAIGWKALADDTGGSNVAVGYLAGFGNTGGTSNVYVGISAGGNGGNASGNTAIGANALESANIGSGNTAVGTLTLINTTGSSNVAIGASAGRYETGGNAFYINNQDRTNTAGDKSLSLLYGMFASTAAAQSLTVNVGTMTVTGNIVQSSDLRLKQDVVASDLGLDFILGLRPVAYTLRAAPESGRHYGLIAQELEATLGARSFAGLQRGDTYGIAYTQLIAPMIKSTQELHAEIVALKARVAELEAA